MRSRIGIAVALAVGALACVADAGEKEAQLDLQRTKRALELSFDWLARHQDRDGKWSAKGYGKHCKEKDRCGDAGRDVSDVATTAEVLLAFLAGGHTHKKGPRRSVVESGLSFLRGKQGKDGAIGAAASPEHVFDHARATLALAEAYGMTGTRILRAAARPAVKYLSSTQNEDGGWGFGRGDGKSDLEVTGHAVLALKSAGIAKLADTKDPLRRALDWLNGLTDPKTAEVKAAAVRKDRPSPAPHAGTRDGWNVIIRRMAARKAGPLYAPALKRVARSVPKGAEADPQDVCIRAMASVAGGGDAKPWNALLRTVIVPALDAEAGCKRGSWTPKSTPSKRRGRVLATVDMCRAAQFLFQSASRRKKPKGK